MARYTVTCDTCGSDMDFTTFGGNSRDRQWRADHWSHECAECKQKRVAIENKKNAEKNREEGLAVLIGSDKQIAWAETLRANVLSLVESKKNDFLQYYAEEIVEEIEDESTIVWLESLSSQDLKIEIEKMFDYAFSVFISKNKSSYWISNQFSSLYEIVDILVQIPSQNQQVSIDIAKNLQKEAELEATVRPSETITETIATISIISDEKISISFPEKREDFRLLVKEHRYSWSGGTWERKIGYISGTIADRVADIGNQLLQNGFIIRIFDEELRQKAIDAIYEPEHTRWIQEYKGKFSIRWKRYFEDFYEEARKIPTSKWDNPTVDVKSEQFEAVEDFANEYDFRFTPKAQELLEQVKRAKEAQLIPKIKKGKEPKKAIVKEKNFELKEGNIDETLLD